MNTHFRFVGTAFAAALLAMGISVPAAQAQRPHSLAKATVPFAFQYGSRAFPAGKYSFSMIADSVLEVQGKNIAALGVVDWTDDNKPARNGKLVFHRDGDRYILRDIWVPALGAHLRCPQGTQHKHQEIAQAQPVSASPDVEVALLEGPR